MDSIGEGFQKIGELDISLKIGGAIAFAAASFGAIAIPTNQQKEESALQLYARPMSRLTPQEKKAAEFKAGLTRWNHFWEDKVYPMTRKLPGAQTPILNPYRGLFEPLGGAGDGDDD